LRFRELLPRGLAITTGPGGSLDRHASSTKEDGLLAGIASLLER
jgi:hypothetical protein